MRRCDVKTDPSCLFLVSVMRFVGLGYGYFMKTKKSNEGFVSVTVTSSHRLPLLVQ